MTHPLTELLSEKTPFEWTPTRDSTFQDLKAQFREAPILQHFDYTKQIFIDTDASDYALGAVASQYHGKSKHPFAFHSRKFTPAELNYEIHDKEMLTIVESFKVWRHYCESSNITVLVHTDHKSLEYFTTTKQLNRRQARWSVFLQEFDFTIRYHPGAQAGAPDALSRRPDYHPGPGKSMDSTSNSGN